MTSSIMTRLSSAPARGSDGCHRKWQAGGLWAKGALHGKVGGAFSSSATQHGGQETTLFFNLLHFGMTIVGLNYGFAGQMGVKEVTGGTPYGATTIADTAASRARTNSQARAIKAG